MGLQTRMGDDGVSVTVAEAMTDCDELWEERNRLAIGLRVIIAEIDDTHAADPSSADAPNYLRDYALIVMSLRDAAFGALSDTFPDDPLGRMPLYDCPDAHGRNRLREELDAD